MIYNAICPYCSKMSEVYFEVYRLDVQEIFECKQCSEKFAGFFDITVKSKTFKLVDKTERKERKKPGPKTNEKKPGKKKPGPKPQKKKTKK